MKKRVLLLVLLGLKPFTGWGQGLETHLDPDFMVLTSFDVARQLLTGPSYEDFKSHYDTYGFNVFLAFNPLDAIGKLQDDYHRDLSKRSQQNLVIDPLTLLASTDNTPGPAAPEPKASSEFIRHLSPLIGIQLIGKGGKYSDRFGTSTTHMTYLEIPAYVLYNHLLPEGKGRLFGGLGFYLAYGLWGKANYVDGTGTSGSFGAFDINGGGYKRFDAGLNFMVGYQMPQGLRLILVHELGLTSIDPVAGADKTKNRVLSLNVGYPLKKLTEKLRKK